MSGSVMSIMILLVTLLHYHHLSSATAQTIDNTNSHFKNLKSVSLLTNNNNIASKTTTDHRNIESYYVYEGTICLEETNAISEAFAEELNEFYDSPDYCTSHTSDDTFRTAEICDYASGIDEFQNACITEVGGKTIIVSEYLETPLTDMMYTSSNKPYCISLSCSTTMFVHYLRNSYESLDDVKYPSVTFVADYSLVCANEIETYQEDIPDMKDFLEDISVQACETVIHYMSADDLEGTGFGIGLYPKTTCVYTEKMISGHKDLCEDVVGGTQLLFNKTESCTGSGGGSKKDVILYNYPVCVVSPECLDEEVVIAQWNEAHEILDYNDDKECERKITFIDTAMDSEAPSISPPLLEDDDASIDDEDTDEHDGDDGYSSSLVCANEIEMYREDTPEIKEFFDVVSVQACETVIHYMSAEDLEGTGFGFGLYPKTTCLYTEKMIYKHKDLCEGVVGGTQLLFNNTESCTGSGGSKEDIMLYNYPVCVVSPECLDEDVVIAQWNEAYEISDKNDDKECKRKITFIDTAMDSKAPSSSPSAVDDDDASVSSFDDASIGDDHIDEDDEHEHDDEHDNDSFHIISTFPAHKWCVQPEIVAEVGIDVSASIIIRKCDGSIVQEWTFDEYGRIQPESVPYLCISRAEFNTLKLDYCGSSEDISSLFIYNYFENTIVWKKANEMAFTISSYDPEENDSVILSQRDRSLHIQEWVIKF